MKEKKTVQLRFHQGTIAIKNLARSQEPIYSTWDTRSQCWRTKGIYYKDVIEWLRLKNISFADSVPRFRKIRLKLKFDYQLHFYQKEGLESWRKANSRGSILLPTGSGKSFLALKAIHQIKMSTLIILPTIDLMNQWYDLLTEAFDIKVGILGGGYHDVENVTVTTYDSAYIYAEQYGNRFQLIVFDEVHHLPSANYSQIAEMCIAQHRLGLTATYQRLDGLHGKLERLIGPIVYGKAIHELRGSHLSEFEIVRIKVELLPEERKRYDEYTDFYNAFIRETGFRFHGPKLEKFLKEVNLKPNARKALLAKFNARKIVLNAERKLDVLESLLKQHLHDRIIVFTESNDLVYSISTEFLIPAITHQTKTIERKLILDRFKKGTYSVLVTSKVLNEGVNVPEANVGIILSGNSSPKEYLQRLGRLLRKKEGKQSILYEIVTKGTNEMLISYRRRQNDVAKGTRAISY